MSKKTIKKCLDAIEVTSEHLKDCTNLQEEFSKIKKAYFKKILVSHPDKGGDAAVFRDVQTSFEVIRDVFDKNKIKSFVTSAGESAKQYDNVYQDFEKRQTPSWEYYYEAAAEAVPGYRVEPARSGRSACKQKGSAKKCDDPIIEKGELRVGSMDQEAGSYGRWVHIPCWRVPSRVWLGLKTCSGFEEFRKALLTMNGVLLSGLSELSLDQLDIIVAHVMDEGNWAKLTKPRKAPESANGSAGPTPTGEDSGTAEVKTQAIVAHTGKQHFLVPVPGQGGANSSALAGKTVVVTGVFPEVGGGAGLDLGKGRVKKMVEAFGGRVTSAVSGKTDILIVGKEPGYSKVSKARSNPRTTLMELKDLTERISSGSLTDGDDGSGGGAIVASKPVVIPKFSSGYRGNSLALEASTGEFDATAGVVVPKAKVAKAAKPAAKAAPKSTAKAAPKSTAKPAAKAAPKSTAKSAKPAAKPAAKALAKRAIKSFAESRILPGATLKKEKKTLAITDVKCEVEADVKSLVGSKRSRSAPVEVDGIRGRGRPRKAL